MGSFQCLPGLKMGSIYHYCLVAVTWQIISWKFGIASIRAVPWSGIKKTGSKSSTDTCSLPARRDSKLEISCIQRTPPTIIVTCRRKLHILYTKHHNEIVYRICSLLMLIQMFSLISTLKKCAERDTSRHFENENAWLFAIAHWKSFIVLFLRICSLNPFSLYSFSIPTFSSFGRNFIRDFWVSWNRTTELMEIMLIGIICQKEAHVMSVSWIRLPLNISGRCFCTGFEQMTYRINSRDFSLIFRIV